MLIVRYCGTYGEREDMGEGGASRRLRAVFRDGTPCSTWRLQRSIRCLLLGVDGDRHGRFFSFERRDNTAERTQAEETLATRIAAIRGDFQKPLEEEERTSFNAVARDVLEVKVSASGTMRILNERKSDTRCIEAALTGFAAPGPAAKKGECEIGHTTSMRAKTFSAAALRTQHCSTPQ